jgi:hypothetical protein
MTKKKLTTHRLIETLEICTPLLEQEETAFLEYIDKHLPNLDADATAFLQERIDSNTDFLNGNLSLLEKIHQCQKDGWFPFLDPTQYRTAILRLKSAILLAKTIGGNS